MASNSVASPVEPVVPPEQGTHQQTTGVEHKGELGDVQAEAPSDLGANAATAGARAQEPSSGGGSARPDASLAIGPGAELLGNPFPFNCEPDCACDGDDSLAGKPARRVRRQRPWSAPVVIQADGGEDVEFSFGRKGERLTIRRLLAALRKRGAFPQQAPLEDDEVVARIIAALPEAPDPNETPYFPSGTRDSTPTPSRWFGVNKARCSFEAGTFNEVAYGSWANAVFDIAAAGGGYIRQMDDGDLTWAQLFRPPDGRDVGDAQIPPPADLYAQVTADGFAATWKFSLLLVACAIARVKAIPCLFSWGGGGALNVDAGSVALKDQSSPEALPPWTVDVPAMYEARPSYEAGVIVPSIKGWHEFYWDHSGDPGDLARLSYQRFALNVQRTEDEDLPADRYHSECARRKALALTAFGTAIGELLAAWDAALRGYGGTIADLVPYVECGNEMDVYWCRTIPAEAGAEHALTYVAGGEEQFATFVGCLAAPIRAVAPGVQVKAGELGGWPNWDEFFPHAQWLHDAVDPGMFDLVEAWGSVVDVREAMVDATDETLAFLAFFYPNTTRWIETCEEADWSWPPEWHAGSYAVSDLVHQLGFHWYHFATAPYPEAPSDEPEAITEGKEVDEPELVDTVDQFYDIVLNPLAEAGLSNVTWAVSSIGFPAEEPFDTLDYEPEAPAWDYRDLTTQGFYQASGEAQGAMLVRLLLLLRCRGATLVLWHTHMARITYVDETRREVVGDLNDETAEGAAPDPIGWDLYSSMGLRVDALDRDNETDDAYLNFTAESDATRRPSWYALRRLVWLTNDADEFDLVYSEDGAFVVRLWSSSGFSSPDVLMRARYSYAVIPWISHGSREDNLLIAFDTDLEDVTRFGLVPYLGEDALESGSVENGFAVGRFPAWDAPERSSEEPCCRADQYMIERWEAGGLVIPWNGILVNKPQQTEEVDQLFGMVAYLMDAPGLDIGGKKI